VSDGISGKLALMLRKDGRSASARRPIIPRVLKTMLVAPLILLVSFHLLHFISDNIHREGQGLIGDYHQGTDFSRFLFRRVDDRIFFDSKGFPGGVPQDDFSVRWTGQVFAPSEGTYTFALWSDDGVRLWIDEKPVIDDWRVHDETLNKSKVPLSKGWHPLRLDYFQSKSERAIRFYWAPPGELVGPVAPRYLRPGPAPGDNG